jgi:hypothetical protein
MRCCNSCRDRGFDYAEVTAGLCGEILDVDGRIGGYNFQWAWASGRLAGIHAAKAQWTVAQ